MVFSESTIRSIAIVTPFYPPHVGGVERYSQEFARAALAKGISVNIITTDSTRYVTDTMEDGIRVLRLPAHYLPMMGSHYPIAANGWRQAGRLLRCDAVIAQTRFFMTSLVAAVLAARNGTPTWVVDHGAGPLRSASRTFTCASLAYEHLVTSILKTLSPKFLAVSGASARWLRRFGINDAQILPNGVAPTPERPQRNLERCGKELRVFYAGRLFAEKGIVELVEGVELSARRGLRVSLRIAGDGALKSALEERAVTSSCFTFLGRIGADEVKNELQAADVFVHPSGLPEGLPTILLEAGSAGLPVISTPFGGSAELIHDGSTGWLIPRPDAGLIAESLQVVASEPDEAIQRGLALYRLVQSSYTWPQIVSTFLRLAGTGAAA